MNTAECSGTEPAKCSEMMRCCGCGSPDERREWACEDEERNYAKNVLLVFKGPFLAELTCLWNGGRHERLEQPNGTKGTTGERPLDCP